MSAFGRLARREMILLSANARTLAIVLLAPFVFAFIVGSVYDTKKLTALPVTIIDQDHSRLSREITRALLATEPFVPGPSADSPADFDVLAAEDVSHVCFVFPAHFERDVKSGRATRVAALVDASNLATGNMAVTAAASVLSSYSVGIDAQKMILHGIPEAGARAASLPISMETRTLFNPALNGNYANFLVIGFLGIAVQLAGLLTAASMGAVTADLPPSLRERRSAAAFHLAVVTLIVWASAFVMVSWSIRCFEFPMKGSWWLLALTILWFVMNLTAMGFAISAMTHDSLFASQVCAIITMPNFLVSGFTWPVFAMPHAMQWLAYLLPMNPFVLALRKIGLMGAGAGDLGFELGLLAAWSIVAAGLLIFGAFRLARRAPLEAAA